MNQRIKFHYLARLAPLVEANFNFIELGPRGNGKSYTFSEFSPYSTLLGAPTSAATLWWNNGRKQVGIIGFWDVVAFDEVGEGITVRDKETFQVMKQYMANGNFTRSSSAVTANASLAFVGNIDDSIDAVVNSPIHTLFKPLHPVFDLAILDRFHTFLPGWEIPKNKDENLTRSYGLIIEYLAEAFHHLARKTNRFAQVKAACKLRPGYDQRDQTAVLKTVCAFVKMLHPGDEPRQDEVNEYLAYAIEGRRRVKEQLNKRKPDDEFADINLGYFGPDGNLIIVFCPESRNAAATQTPTRTPAMQDNVMAQPETVPPPAAATAVPSPPVPTIVAETAPITAIAGGDAIATQAQPAPKERHYRIHYGATGYSYESIFRDYLPGAQEIVIEDPYIRQQHQIINFLRFCETSIRIGKPKKLTLVTRFESQSEKDDAMGKLFTIADSLKQFDVILEIKENSALHDREIRLSNGWKIKIGRGFDIYQRPDDWLQIGANDLDLRPCLETMVDIFSV